MAGDLLPHPLVRIEHLGLTGADFVPRFLVPGFSRLRKTMETDYPDVFLIPGNDDIVAEEEGFLCTESIGIWNCLHARRTEVAGRPLYGYACIPPSPYPYKDWERYDVSRYVDPGCVSPEEGSMTVPATDRERRYRTIAGELGDLTGDQPLTDAIFLFHVPPYDTKLDTADLSGRFFDGVPLDTHIGSIAVQRLIERRQPYLTLHGHVHEAYRLTGVFKQRIGRTWALSAANEGPQLALVSFDLEDPGEATRREL